MITSFLLKLKTIKGSMAMINQHDNTPEKSIDHFKLISIRFNF